MILFQFIYILLSAISLGFSIKDHGQPKTGKHNAWFAIIGISLGYWLLIRGGAFTELLNLLK